MHEPIFHNGELGDLLKEVLGSRGILRLRASGRSMHPAIRDGDVLHVSAVSPSQIGMGDVAVYISPSGSIVAHRALWFASSMDRRYLVSRADSLSAPLEFVPEEHVIARVNCLLRSGGLIPLTGRLRSFEGRFRAVVSLLGHCLIRPVKRRGRAKS